MPAMSAASGWPWPDIRWHAPHANLIPWPPVPARGAGGCSSGNQSGGLAVPATLAHSYSFALPGALTMPSTRTAAGWTLSGMLNAQSGSPSGTLSASWALGSRTMRSGARTHKRTAMRTDVFVRGIRRITGGSPLPLSMQAGCNLSRWGNEVYVGDERGDLSDADDGTSAIHRDRFVSTNMGGSCLAANFIATGHVHCHQPRWSSWFSDQHLVPSQRRDLPFDVHEVNPADHSFL